MIFSPLYFVFALPALLLGLWAQYKVQSAFSKYSRVRSTVGLSGAEIARRMLDMSGLYNVKVEMVQGFLSDHYDPRITRCGSAQMCTAVTPWQPPGWRPMKPGTPCSTRMLTCPCRSAPPSSRPFRSAAG